MVDDGQLTPEEASSHPERALLLRALDGRPGVTPDLHLQEAHAADRYLLCSDGLSAVVPDDDIHRTLATIADPQQALNELIDRVRRAGAPDNVSCVVADVVPGPAG
jgi:protein phosphatase